MIILIVVAYSWQHSRDWDHSATNFQYSHLGLRENRAISQNNNREKKEANNVWAEIKEPKVGHSMGQRKEVLPLIIQTEV